MGRKVGMGRKTGGAAEGKRMRKIRELTSKMFFPYAFQINIDLKSSSHAVERSAPRQAGRNTIILFAVTFVEAGFRAGISEAGIYGRENLAAGEMDL